MKPTRRARTHDCGDDLRHHLTAWDRAGFTRLLWAEFTKFRTVRAWVIALCAAAIVFVLLSFLSAFESREPVPAVPTGPGGEAVSDTYMFVHRTLAGDGAITARVAGLRRVPDLAWFARYRADEVGSHGLWARARHVI